MLKRLIPLLLALLLHELHGHEQLFGRKDDGGARLEGVGHGVGREDVVVVEEGGE